jgi:hypothetical protein
MDRREEDVGTVGQSAAAVERRREYNEAVNCVRSRNGELRLHLFLLLEELTPAYDGDEGQSVTDKSSTSKRAVSRRY